MNLSSTLAVTENDRARLAVVYGAGVQNSMNDAPVDVAIDTAKRNCVALPLLGVVTFLEHTWSEKFSAAIGYSMLDIDNTNTQRYDAFNRGSYALGNVAYSPVRNVMMVCELQWGKRENLADHADLNSADAEAYLRTAEIFTVRLSFKFNFSHEILFEETNGYPAGASHRKGTVIHAIGRAATRGHQILEQEPTSDRATLDDKPVFVSEFPQP